MQMLNLKLVQRSRLLQQAQRNLANFQQLKGYGPEDYGQQFYYEKYKHILNRDSVVVDIGFGAPLSSWML